MDSAQDLDFVPCDATASGLLYAWKSAILYYKFEEDKYRIFNEHDDKVLLLAINNNCRDNPSNRVASADVGLLLIWNLPTLRVLRKQYLPAQVTALTWMRDGYVVTGDATGTVLASHPILDITITLFGQTDKGAITALAALDDCQTLAIGYQDGSLLIVLRPPQSNVLRPPFNALETPSEVHMVAIYPLPVTVINLAWHAHVKSQFLGSLAVQTQCGDLEVWNVPKNPRESKKIRCKAIQWEDIRYPEGHHWMGWLKDGHLFHGSKREIHFWDVRKQETNTTSCQLPDKVIGMAMLGRDACVFTIGRNGKISHVTLPATASAKK